MKLKMRSALKRIREQNKRGYEILASGSHRKEEPDDTAARVKAVLAQLKNKNFIVLAKMQSDSDPKMKYEIRMGSNNAVWCQCKGWQYSKTGTCKHIERFRERQTAQLL